MLYFDDFCRFTSATVLFTWRFIACFIFSVFLRVIQVLRKMAINGKYTCLLYFCTKLGFGLGWGIVAINLHFLLVLCGITLVFLNIIRVKWVLIFKDIIDFFNSFKIYSCFLFNLILLLFSLKYAIISP